LKIFLTIIERKLEGKEKRRNMLKREREACYRMGCGILEEHSLEMPKIMEHNLIQSTFHHL
jgi:hypothetical protein